MSHSALYLLGFKGQSCYSPYAPTKLIYPILVAINSFFLQSSFLCIQNFHLECQIQEGWGHFNKMYWDALYPSPCLVWFLSWTQRSVYSTQWLLSLWPEDYIDSTWDLGAWTRIKFEFHKLPVSQVTTQVHSRLAWGYFFLGGEPKGHHGLEWNNGIPKFQTRSI